MGYTSTNKSIQILTTSPQYFSTEYLLISQNFDFCMIVCLTNIKFQLQCVGYLHGISQLLANIIWLFAAVIVNLTKAMIFHMKTPFV